LRKIGHRILRGTKDTRNISNESDGPEPKCSG
jgi:hypothetical protein